jgi:hypothetical protein
MWDSSTIEIDCAFAEQNGKRNINQQSTTSPKWRIATPQPITINFGPLGQSIVKMFASIGLGVFVLRGAGNGHFLYLATTVHNAVQSVTVPTRDKFLKGITTVMHTFSRLISVDK